MTHLTPFALALAGLLLATPGGAAAEDDAAGGIGLFKATRSVWKEHQVSGSHALTISPLREQNLHWRVRFATRADQPLAEHTGVLHVSTPDACDQIEIARVDKYGRSTSHDDQWKLTRHSDGDWGTRVHVALGERSVEPVLGVAALPANSPLACTPASMGASEPGDPAEREPSECVATDPSAQQRFEAHRAARARAESCFALIEVHSWRIEVSGLDGSLWASEPLPQPSGRDWLRTAAWTAPAFALDLVAIPLQAASLVLFLPLALTL